MKTRKTLIINLLIWFLFLLQIALLIDLLIDVTIIAFKEGYGITTTLMLLSGLLYGLESPDEESDEEPNSNKTLDNK